MRKGRWHGAAVTEGSIRLDVLTKPGSTGKLGRSLSQPGADSSLYAREPPSSVTPYGVPPSPWGKATSGGDITVYLLCCLLAISPGDPSTGCYTAVERGCGEWDIHKNTPQLFYKLWSIFLDSPGGSGGGAGERLLICVISFLFVLYSSLSTVISWFSTKFIHSCGYSCG